MQLTIASDDHTAAALLQQIARLCAAHGAQWPPELWVEVVDGCMRLLEPPPQATTAQRELLEMHAQLYNATGKVHWWARRHPARLVYSSAEVALRAGAAQTWPIDA
jgi:hypothetical protein